MKQKGICFVLACLCLGLLLLSGCREKAPESTEPIITWENIPQLTYGQMEAEKLSVLPWYSGRTETSTFHKMVETEQGYYLIYYERYLFYADKSDLSSWIPVCNQPNCRHKEVLGCQALCNRWVWMRNGRLFCKESSGLSPHLYQPKGKVDIFVSCLPDMTDKRLEFVNEDAILTQGGSGVGSAILGNCLVQSVSSIDEMGNSYCDWFVYDQNGCRKIQGPGVINDFVFMGDTNNFTQLKGELGLCYGQFEDFSLYRLVEDTFVRLHVDPALLAMNGYLSGNTLRYFKENEGYYDYDISTGNTVKVSDPYRENSLACILAPNCIIETNMRYPSAYIQPPQGDSWLAVFDGECWRDVQLPPELATISDEHILYVEGMTSDSILIRICPKKDTMQYILYRIPIGKGQLQLEYCCKIDFPKNRP